MSQTNSVSDHFVRSLPLADVQEKSLASTTVGDRVVALVWHEDEVYAVDNRCPPMGFPMDQGSVRNGILTCHWHHARFDLQSGGTFDLWADDVPAFPVEIREGDVWVDVRTMGDLEAQAKERLQAGLERNLSLVVGKSAIFLEERGCSRELIEAGLRFGCQYRQEGWGQGLTILGCMVNLLPNLARADRSRALFHGLAAVAGDTASSPFRYTVQPLPGENSDLQLLHSWFRQFIEVRDAEGAERCLISAMHVGADPAFLMDMLGTAATDRRYIDIGHPMDFTNKAFQVLDHTGWEDAELVLTSLVGTMAMARRMEESNAWRAPIDLVELLNEAFLQLDEALEQGETQQDSWAGDPDLVDTILSAGPHELIARMLAVLREGMPPEELALHVCYAAAVRIAQFHTSNEISDWDTALHTFTFANAVLQAFQRTPVTTLLRGVFDAAMSVYLDRFLNIPAARIPAGNRNGLGPEQVLEELGGLLNQQYRVNQAAVLVAGYVAQEGELGNLRASLGQYLLREDRDFHTIQCIEAAFALQDELRSDMEAWPWLHRDLPLIAASRYLAAHAPTMRAQGQTYDIALRLHRGEKMFEG